MSRAGSRPANLQMEPARPIFRAIVSLARGSFGPLGRPEQKVTKQ
jgi:hypothetical protein